ncbi:MAG: helix-turn-helix transcriptional regulator [Lachnospiraceae bacterium]|nr:helix-turn-helix transcriptional regulator [Lachnospiraceae bacterium]
MEKKKLNSEIFCSRLDKVMRFRGISNRTLAENLFVAESTISGYRNGHRTPDLDKLRELCEAIPVSADYLLGLTDRPYF